MDLKKKKKKSASKTCLPLQLCNFQRLFIVGRSSSHASGFLTMCVLIQVNSFTFAIQSPSGQWKCLCVTYQCPKCIFGEKLPSYQTPASTFCEICFIGVFFFNLWYKNGSSQMQHVTSAHCSISYCAHFGTKCLP